MAVVEVLVQGVSEPDAARAAEAVNERGKADVPQPASQRDDLTPLHRPSPIAHVRPRSKPLSLTFLVAQHVFAEGASFGLLKIS